MRYRKKPVEVEAFQYFYNTEDKTVGHPKWLIDAILARVVEETNTCLVIHTLEGTLKVSEGDFIIQGVKGELYPCKPDIFHQTYDAVPS